MPLVPVSEEPQVAKRQCLQPCQELLQLDTVQFTMGSYPLAEGALFFRPVGGPRKGFRGPGRPSVGPGMASGAPNGLPEGPEGHSEKLASERLCQRTGLPTDGIP